MKRKPAVILFDLWRTLGFSMDRDPILDVQVILEHNIIPEAGPIEVIEDPQFMRSCLTTNINDKRSFLEQIATKFGRHVNESSHAAFNRLLHQETSNFQLYDDVLPTLKTLKSQGYRLGLVSNLWPFPAPFLFDELGLGAFFEHLIYSFAVGHAKPEKEIFEKAVELFGVPPGQMLMVGDNLINDVQGAISAGLQAALIDRSGKAVQPISSCIVLKSLCQLCQPLIFSFARKKSRQRAVA